MCIIVDNMPFINDKLKTNISMNNIKYIESIYIQPVIIGIIGNIEIRIDSKNTEPIILILWWNGHYVHAHDDYNFNSMDPYMFYSHNHQWSWQ